jgi:putative effector of murein hydrolase LrgA (UPF0299 family)
MTTMALSITACLASFVVLVWTLRLKGESLGLPIAYLFGLLLIHVPGALAHQLGADVLRDSNLTELGIRFTAIGAICFVVGVWAARMRHVKPRTPIAANRRQFFPFCLIGGWVFTYGLSSLGQIPSVGAAIQEGGAVWMLGVLLGVRAALRRGDVVSTAGWLAALAVYPVLMLLLAGFLSYGSAAAIIVLSVLAISIRSPLRVAAGIIFVALLAFNGFLNYFQHRDEIREAVWYGASLKDRVDVSLNVLREFEWFDPSNPSHLKSLDIRLNQNFFVGLAAARIAEGDVSYLYGRSVWEGLTALVPRVLWPDKPVFAGSPKVVSEMTGLTLTDTTSWGVGNVMELQINFGMPGVIVGFLLLGWLLGMLDRKAAAAEASGHLGRMFFMFLPAVALIQPNGSLVELAGGSAAALVAAVGWNWSWTVWSRRHPARAPTSLPGPTRVTL